MTVAQAITSESVSTDTRRLNELLEDFQSEDGGDLVAILLELNRLGYNKDDIVFTLAINGQTYDKWEKGGGMQEGLQKAFVRMVSEIIQHRPQRLVNVSQTGLVSPDFLWQVEYRQADIIWCYTNDGFYNQEDRTLFEQLIDVYCDRPQLLIIYIVQKGTAGSTSLHSWKNRLDSFNNNTIKFREAKRLQVGIVGYEMEEHVKDDLFLYCARIFSDNFRLLIVESGKDYRAYLQVPFADEPTNALRKALNITQASGVFPWIQLHSRVGGSFLTQLTHMKIFADRIVKDKRRKNVSDSPNYVFEIIDTEFHKNYQVTDDNDARMEDEENIVGRL